MSIFDELTEDVIDLHCHIDIEFSLDSRKREPESVWLPKAEAMGMRGFVLKSHWWPTANVVPYILESVQTSVMLWSSVTLNEIVGGPTPYAVEACAKLGGKVVFLPTWSARDDIKNGGFSSRLAKYYKSFDVKKVNGYTFLDKKDDISSLGKEIIESAKHFNVVLGTGHVSWAESLAFAEAAHEMKFKQLIINHPLNARTRAPIDGLRRAAKLGAFIEICWTHLAPGRMKPDELVGRMREIGLDQIIVSTDYFRPYSPNPPELMRMFLGMLHEGGLTKREIRQVASINPARALGLK